MNRYIPTLLFFLSFAFSISVGLALGGFIEVPAELLGNIYDPR